MPITPVFLDGETYWDTEHSLSKMSPIEYVMSPKTELISFSVQVDGQPPQCAFGESEIRYLMREIDWASSLAVAHNMSGFDAMLLAWRLGIKPAMWGCTLAMARPLHAKTTGLSLAKLVAHYANELRDMGISGVKDNTALVQTKGKRLAEFTPAERVAMARYNNDDTAQCGGLFHILKKHYSAAELWHLDCNIRMLVEAEFDLDAGLLQTALSVERANKHKALLDVAKFLRADDSRADEITALDWGNEAMVSEWVRVQMASAPKFSLLLKSFGVDTPMKRSKTDPDKLIPALAKTDEAMAELLDHDEPVVAAAARARLSAKSTQLETRIESFLATHKAVGKLPVPVHYCGAETTGRDSGWLYNMLNLPRINPDKPSVKDALRNSVRAPEGKVIGVADLSGIELRVNHTLWKVARTMAMWKEKANADLYKDTAARMYDCTVDEVAKHQRQYSKVLELSCGFGIGGDKFRETARIQGGIKLTKQESKKGVDFWRSLYPEIASFDKNNPGGWQLCQEALNYIAEGSKRAIDPWGLCTTEKDAIRLPSGRTIYYPNLRQELRPRYKEVDGVLHKSMEVSWVYADGRHIAGLYGGKCDENIVQALARDIIFPNALEFFKRTKLRPKHKVYDELVYLFPPSEAEALLAELQSIMRTPPSWWPELVLWSEGDIAHSYGAAK